MPQLAEIMSELSQRRQRDVQELARIAAFGGDVEAEEVDRALVREGKSPSDFCDLVELLQERQRRRDEMDQIDDLVAAKKECQRQVVEANETLEAAVQLHQRTCTPLQLRMKQLQEEISALRKIPAELRDTCPDARSKKRFEQTQIMAHHLSQKSAAARRPIAGTITALRNSEREQGITLNGEWKNVGADSDPDNLPVAQPLQRNKRLVREAVAAYSAAVAEEAANQQEQRDILESMENF